VRLDNCSRRLITSGHGLHVPLPQHAASDAPRPGAGRPRAAILQLHCVFLVPGGRERLVPELRSRKVDPDVLATRLAVDEPHDGIRCSCIVIDETEVRLAATRSLPTPGAWLRLTAPDGEELVLAKVFRAAIEARCRTQGFGAWLRHAPSSAHVGATPRPTTSIDRSQRPCRSHQTGARTGLLPYAVAAHTPRVRNASSIRVCCQAA